jgi:hypothetical protein
MARFELHSIQFSQNYVLFGDVENNKNNSSIIQFQGVQDDLEFWRKDGGRFAKSVRFVINLKAIDFNSEDFLPKFIFKIPGMHLELPLLPLNDAISQKDCFAFQITIPTTLGPISPAETGSDFKVFVLNGDEVCGETTISLREIPRQ